VRKLFFVFWLNLIVALALSLAPLAQQTTSATAEQKAKKSDETPLFSGPMSYASTNHQILVETLKREPKRLTSEPKDGKIAKYMTLILENAHISQHAFDDSISSRFLDRYLEALDVLHLHFLESDIKDFEKYRTSLDELTAKEGDVTPAHLMFTRFLQRLQQRAAYVGELLESEKFEFTAEDRYNVDRRKTPRAKNLEEAKQIWRQHLRYEILQERLNKEKPEEIGSKLTRRYARMLRTLKDYDADDVLELYLSALARVYDPHTDYMGKSAFDSFNIGMKLSLFGIGALLRSEDGYCKIQSLVPNGPAAKSKQIKENDRIIAVAQAESEPIDVVDEKLSKVVDMIRGPKDSIVNLTIVPGDAADLSVRKVVRLVRDEIKLEDQEAKAKLIEMPSEGGKMLRLGVIDLPSFYADFELSGKKTDGEPKSTTADVKKLLRKLKKENVDGVILDLRRNGGGSLEEAINLT
jgi:carboxyl-terminal processing protease